MPQADEEDLAVTEDEEDSAVDEAEVEGDTSNGTLDRQRKFRVSWTCLLGPRREFGFV